MSGPAAPWWPALEASEVAARLETDLQRGLPQAEVAARAVRFGKNALDERGGRSAWAVLRAQFTSAVVAVLLVAAGVSAAVGGLKDAVAILAILALNAALGFIQEYRAERSMAALRRFAAPRLRVRRSGEVLEVAAPELVPGDLVLLEAGNLVPADGRIVEASSLRIDEAILTGESTAVDKRARALPVDQALALGDQDNMAFMGTVVVLGRGALVVTATGMSTELGRIARLLQGVTSTQTPLQQRLDGLGRALALAALAVVALIFALGLALGEDWRLMLMTSVSMAVALIPEGLPAVVTIALALGAQRMFRRHALIRRLPAVETLGSVTVICSDKTGTLTQNQMAVTTVDVAGLRVDLSGPSRPSPHVALLLTGGALCSDAALQPAPTDAGGPRALGDPTEVALVVAAAAAGLRKDQLEAMSPRVAELPFDSDRRRMTTVHRVTEPGAWAGAGLPVDPGQWLAFTKGAPDAVLEVSTHRWDGTRAVALDPAWRARLRSANDALAQGGMRVLAVAFRFLEPGAEVKEQQLVFVGLVGLMDPPRPEAREAIARCQQAGIRVLMITGDHPATALRIAKDLGMNVGAGRVATGPDLEALSGPELQGLVDQVSVFARVAPEQKLRIVEALQRQGHVVAMTGDGVNDAPALRRADIGVAMGSGTDVSKEAAAMVLVDDDFSTIVAAVEEGRAINDNIRRFIKFSLAGNLGKLLLVFGGPLLGMPLPLLPSQILWLNLVTDGVLGLGIGTEPAQPGAMTQPPRRPGESVLGRGLVFEIAWQGLLLGVVNLAVTFWAWRSGVEAWQTVSMTTVLLLQVAQALASRSARVAVFAMSPLSNPALLAAIAALFGLQAAAVLAPPFQALLATAPLSATQLFVSLTAGAGVLLFVEGIKWLRRTGAQRAEKSS